MESERGGREWGKEREGGEAAMREGCSEAVCREEARINSHCRYRRLGQVMEHDGEFSSASGTHTALAGASLSLSCCVLSQRLACLTVLTEQKAGFALRKSSSHELFINDLVGILPLGGQPGARAYRFSEDCLSYGFSSLFGDFLKYF